MKVFIGGSKNIGALPAEAIEAIESFIDEGHRILIGDCYGVDLCVQRILAERGYKNVTVYCSGDVPRNNVGDWAVNALHVEGLSGYEFYRQKDLAMAADCDCGYMVWDGVSKGTRHNIEELKRLGKPVRTKVVPKKSENLDMATFFGRDTGLNRPIWLDFLNASNRVIYYGPSREITITFSSDGHIDAPDFPDKEKVGEWVALNLTPLNNLYSGKDDKGNRYTIESFARDALPLRNL